jgi:hypothetical protein
VSQPGCKPYDRTSELQVPKSGFGKFSWSWRGAKTRKEFELPKLLVYCTDMVLDTMPEFVANRS